METTITSTAGLIPVSLSLVGLMAALQYLKGMTDYAAAVRLVFFGFLFLFAAKVLALATSVMPTEYYYAVKLTLSTSKKPLRSMTLLTSPSAW